MRIHVQTVPPDSNTITPDDWREAATAAGPVGAGHAVSFGTTDAELETAIGEMEVLITVGGVLRRRSLASAPHLRAVFLMHAGIDGLAPFEWMPPNVALINNSGAHSDKAGEYVAMAVLMMSHHLPVFIGQQHQKVWKKRRASVLAGRRATVVGVGSLGGGSARRLRSFGLHVTGVRTRADPHPDCDEVVASADLDSVLPQTEFLALACPLTPATQNILDRRRIGLLPRGAGVVNVGRGLLIEQDALLDALDAGELGGAVLDVATPEPPPPEHRIWTTRNLVLTPHMSSDDPATYSLQTLEIFFSNLQALQDGRTPPNLVDLARGY